RDPTVAPVATAGSHQGRYLGPDVASILDALTACRKNLFHLTPRTPSPRRAGVSMQDGGREEERWVGV
ncbi:MAG: hypothetical protein M1337_04620, partial [Actinobacteria bacterium]|nr:hypothetical protein [Actinomycetota bacterium]